MTNRIKRSSLPIDIIMDTVLDGLIVIDAQGAIHSFNKAAASIFQYQPEEVLGKNVKLLMPQPYHGEHDQYLTNYLESGEKKIIGIGRKVSARRKDGSVFPMELGVNEMRVDGERLFVGTIRDISERVAAEQAMAKHINMLSRSNQELDDFAYIASHDLKEPLRGISNNALFLEEDYGELIGGDGRRRLERMQYLCKRLDNLVDELLYYSRLGRQELAVQPCNLNEVIHDIGLLMETTLTKAHAEVSIHGAMPTIICDKPRITEVFRNLITNAIKYNDKPKKIVEVGHIEAAAQHPQAQPAQAVYYVKDNGIGIAPHFYQDIFRIFKRLNDESDAVKGTGVGLTFVKKIIERHNGKIWLESTMGEGSTFYFTLNTQE